MIRMGVVTGFLAVLVVSFSELPAQPFADRQVQPAGRGTDISRGVFKLPTGTEIPFNYVIRESLNGQEKLFFINGPEEFEGGLVRRFGDSVFVRIEAFETELAWAETEELASGFFRRLDRQGQSIALRIEPGKKERFSSESDANPAEISGRYAVTFTDAKGVAEQAIGLFEQDGRRLRATFMKVTGDSRFLEGIVEGDSFRLSSFIGSTPAIYLGRIEAGGRMIGTVEGPRGTVHFTAIPNEAAELPDAYSLTGIRDSKGQFKFDFPDISGRRISLDDEKYRNKVVVIAIGGTWCPNCMDEAAYLAPWYRINKSRGVEIISLQYERSLDAAYLEQVVNRFRNRYGIEYDMAIGGLANKQKVMESLPALDTFISFPTTIIIDKKGKVVKIHTGFTGPATGHYFEEFKQEFEETITRLLGERGVNNNRADGVNHPDARW